MFDLWQLIFSDVHWDNNNRLSQLLKMTASEAVNGVAQAGKLDSDWLTQNNTDL